MRIRLFRNSTGDVIYSNSTPMPEDVHGLKAGTTFSKRKMSQMWTDLLYPYQEPRFNTFALSGYTSPRECGDTIPSGAKTFTWTTVNPDNIGANTIRIEDITLAQSLAASLANDGSEVVTLPTSVVETVNAAIHTWRISALNSKGAVISKEFPITFYSPIYYGAGAEGLDVAGIQQLTKRIAAEGNFSTLITTNLNKVYIAYPAAYGDLASIKDQNLFDITGDFTKTTSSFTNNGTYYKGVTMSYLVYEYKNITSLTNYRFYFNFV